MALFDKFINAMRMDDLMGEETDQAENKSEMYDEYYLDEECPETELVQFERGHSATVLLSKSEKNGERMLRLPDLESDFTFSNLVMGSSNENVFRTIEELKKDNSGKAKVLILKSDVSGCGATHILQALAHEDGKYVDYGQILADYYRSHVVDPPKYEKEEFIEKYDCRVLCIDNTPDMRAVPGVQEKVVEFLNQLYVNLVIFVLEKHLDETAMGNRFLEEMKERFIFRVEEIMDTDFDMKLNILKNILKKKNFILKAETMKKAVNNFRGGDTKALIEYYYRIVNKLQQFHAMVDQFGIELLGLYDIPTDDDSTILLYLEEMYTKRYMGV